MEIVQSFSKFLNNGNELKSIGINYILDNVEELKNKYIFFKICGNVKEIFEIKKYYSFLDELNSGTLSQEQITEHLNKLENDNKLNKELEFIYLKISQSNDLKRTIILGQIYKNYIKCNISESYFYEFVEILERLFLSDLELFKAMYDKETIEKNDINSTKLTRLNSLGLIDYTKSKIAFVLETGEDVLENNEITSLGKIFYKYSIKEVEEKILII